MKRHVTARWLSLLPAIERIIDNIKPLKTYFIGLGTEDCPPIINEFVQADSTTDITICKAYLYFTSHFMSLFHTNIKVLEMKTTIATNLYDIMFKLKTQLENRLKKIVD